jgi:short-subunit dehydrogenase
VIDVSFHAMLFGSKQAVRRFKSRRSAGHIVNVASGAGWIPGGGAVTYGGSKFAVVGFSQALAWELHGSGINVSVVAPAVIRTQLGAGLADVRGLRKVDLDDVGAAIVDALQKPQFKAPNAPIALRQPPPTVRRGSRGLIHLMQYAALELT